MISTNIKQRWEHAEAFHDSLDHAAEMIAKIRNPRAMFTLAAENLHDDAANLILQAETALCKARAALIAHGEAHRPKAEAAS